MPSLRRFVLLATVVATTVATTAPIAAGGQPAPARPSTPTDCEPGAVPFTLAGTDLTPEVRTSADPEPVRYVRWRGTVPTFDGLPLSVDVTVPCDADAAQPTVVMAHGFTDDKTVWQETDASDTIGSLNRPGSNARWNNIWFASRGYVVLNYTARGWRDSCGPDTPGNSAATPAAACADTEFWIHMNDKRWEIRDAQWLAGGLAQSGVSDPERLAITGGSYGGAPALMGALLADQVVCGAAPMPAALGDDPCADADDGQLVDWTTPDGSVPLRWAASIPMYTYGDLLGVLAPNGRVTDGWAGAPASGSPIEPFGVPLQGTVTGLLLAASLSASVPPVGSNPEHDIASAVARLAAGDPFEPDDPEVTDRVAAFRNLKSAVGIEPGGEVPIFWVQGMTDALFPGSEALTVRNRLLDANPDYPVKVFLGDIGHDYAAERQDDWDLVKGQMNDFIDHYLRPDRTPTPPVFDVGATVTRCLDPDAPQQYVAAADWHDLHQSEQVFTSAQEQVTSTTEQGPSGPATDPITGATLPGPNSYKGCRIVQPASPDPTTATYEWDITDPLVLMGGTVVELSVSAPVGGFPVAVRLWDVAPDGAAQALVSRGVYRVDDGPLDRTSLRFQLTPQGYEFATGHRMKVEVTGNDSPYLQASSVATDITVHDLTVTLPRFDASAVNADDAPSGSWTWIAIAILASLAVVGGAIAWIMVTRRRNRTQSTTAPD